jgi:hypothetical protein
LWDNVFRIPVHPKGRSTPPGASGMVRHPFTVDARGDTMRIARRATTVLAGLALTAGAVVTLAGPAQAGLPGGCKNVYTTSLSAGQVVAYGNQYCPDSGPTPLYTVLRQYDPATGAWNTIATGTGEAVHTCAGTTARQYETNLAIPTTYACG